MASDFPEHVCALQLVSRKHMPPVVRCHQTAVMRQPGTQRPQCVLLQISLPVVTVNDCPVGLSLIGPRGSDEALLELAGKLYPLLT